MQAFGDLALFFQQAVELGLAFGAGRFVLLFVLGALGQRFGQVGEGALFFERLTQQWRRVALMFQGRSQCGLRAGLLLLCLFLAGMQFGLLLAMRLNLLGQRGQHGIEFRLARELMTLRCQLLQAAEVLALRGLGVPLRLRALQLFGRGELAFLPFAQLLEPRVLQLQLLELGLLGLELLLRRVELLIQFGAGFGGQGHHAGGLVLQLLVRVPGVFGLVKGAPPELGVKRGIGELFQQLAALVVIGLEERAELALRQQHGAGELFEVQAQGQFQLGLVFGFLAGQQLIAVQVDQALAAVLQLAAGLVAGAVGFPACPVATAADADKIHFSITAARAASQQGARVADGNIAVGIRHLRLAGIAQAGHRAKQRQAQGIEQGAFTGAGRPGDGKQTGTGQGLGGEVDLERSGQGGEVFQADGEDLHGCSPSCCTSWSSTAKSFKVCSSTSLP